MEQNDTNNYTFLLKVDTAFIHNFINILELHQSNMLNIENTRISNLCFSVIYDNNIEIKENVLIQNKKFVDISLQYDDTLLKISDIVHITNDIRVDIAYNDNQIIEILSTEYEEIKKSYDYMELIKLNEFVLSIQNEDVVFIKESATISIGKGRLLGLIVNRLKKYILLTTNYPKIKRSIMYMNIRFVENLMLHFYKTNDSKDQFNNWIAKKILAIEKNIDHKSLIYEHSSVYLKLFVPNETNELNIFFDLLIKLTSNEILFQNNKNTNQTIKITVVRNEYITHTVATNKINNFIKSIGSLAKNKVGGKKVDVYTISILEEIKNEIEENPEYKEYQSLREKYVNEKKSEEDIKLLLPSEPIKTITNTTKHKSVNKKLINSKYHSFNNLYLRKNQDVMLLDIIERFKNDKALMQDLDIPNKLGILLYGHPGCGKTTTILSIASYFGRDIFYINLKSIKTNEDLKMIFDYANSQHSGGSVMVFEDIDAMSNVVQKRSITKLDNINVNDQNLNNLLDSNESEVTLSYLLNLLDGTLTHDDSITIITTNHLEKIDPALYRAGRIDNLVEMKLSDHYQIKKIFKRFIRREINPDVLAKIKEDTFSPAEIIYHLINWVKLSNKSDETIMNYFIEKSID